MPDLYDTFQEMARHEQEGEDFVIEQRCRAPSALILAIHGGPIEEHTDIVARAIAGEDLSFYALIGTRKSGNKDHLHIRSERFKEPRAMAMLRPANTVVAIHGECNTEAEYVMPGGLDYDLRDRIATNLQNAGFSIEDTPRRLLGIDAENICNRGASGMGVQLEISKKLRDKIAGDANALQRFAAAVRAELLIPADGNGA